HDYRRYRDHGRASAFLAADARILLADLGDRLIVCIDPERRRSHHHRALGLCEWVHRGDRRDRGPALWHHLGGEPTHQRDFVTHHVHRDEYGGVDLDFLLLRLTVPRSEEGRAGEDSTCRG